MLAILGAYLIIRPNEKYIQSESNIAEQHIKVGMVLGAGITKDGKPFKELQSRLDIAAHALQSGAVNRLILSGDNRFPDYDEPTAMKQYLMDTYGISSSVLQPDFAGRSTYESCQRAAQVFGQKRIVLFSTRSHLPRAIDLCRHFGIEAYGIPGALEANNATRREMQARVKALYNVYIHGEQTILGSPVTMDDTK
jgi:vancomycin permeability regulator SanA